MDLYQRRVKACIKIINYKTCFIILIEIFRSCSSVLLKGTDFQKEGLLLTKILFFKILHILIIERAVQFIALLVSITKFSRKYEEKGNCKPLFKTVQINISLFMSVPYPHHSTVHAIPIFFLFILAIQDHLRSKVGFGIISI